MYAFCPDTTYEASTATCTLTHTVADVCLNNDIPIVSLDGRTYHGQFCRCLMTSHEIMKFNLPIFRLSVFDITDPKKAHNVVRVYYHANRPISNRSPGYFSYDKYFTAADGSMVHETHGLSRVGITDASVVLEKLLLIATDHVQKRASSTFLSSSAAMPGFRIPNSGDVEVQAVLVRGLQKMDISSSSSASNSANNSRSATPTGVEKPSKKQ